MVFAIVEVGSKQYMVKEHDIIKVEKLETEINSSLDLKCIQILKNSYNDNCGGNAEGNHNGEFDVKTNKKNTSVTKVVAVVLEHKKTKKIIVFKKKRRHNYRRKNGHRQNITVLKIVKIAS